MLSLLAVRGVVRSRSVGDGHCGEFASPTPGRKSTLGLALPKCTAARGGQILPAILIEPPARRARRRNVSAILHKGVRTSVGRF
jgi:hypothetical protein